MSNNNILIVSQNMYIGGVQKYTYQLNQALINLNYNVDIKCYEPENTLEQYKKINYITDINKKYRYIFLNSYPLSEEEILNYLKYSENIISICHTEYHLFTYITNKILNYFYAVISVSDLIIKKIKYNNPNNKFRYSVITPCIGDRLVETTNHNNNKLFYNLLWCGRISTPKGCQLLVKLYSDYLKQRPQCKKWKLFIYGEPAKPFLKNSIEKYKNDNIILNLKPYDKEDFEIFSNNIDLFINTSYTDGFPYTFLEFLSKGIPIISSNIGGIDNLICPEKNGDLFNFKGLYIKEFTGDNFDYSILLKNFDNEYNYNYKIFETIMDKYLLNEENILRLKNHCQFNLNNFTIENNMQTNLNTLLKI